MARLPVLAYPDRRLRLAAQPVGELTPELERLVEDMFETMYATNAIGLAAPQVDVHKRIVTIDVSGDRSAPELFVNPVIVSASRMAMVEESCLSVPGIVANVERATRLSVRAVDRTGATYERDLEDLLAVCLQHEIDHLDGKLFVDRLPLLTRFRVKRKLAAAERRVSS
jgi:peptide deformylase